MAETPGINWLGWLSGAASLLQVTGLLQGGRTAKLAGQRQRLAEEFAAFQAERQAGTTIAISQLKAAEERRQAGMEASRALAVAAASGAGASDPTIVNLIANARGEGVYRANVALYEGEARARLLRLEAAAGRAAGTQAVLEGLRQQTGYQLAGLGAGVRGAASLYAKYGMKGPTNGKRGDAATIAEVDPYLDPGA